MFALGTAPRADLTRPAGHAADGPARHQAGTAARNVAAPWGTGRPGPTGTTTSGSSPILGGKEAVAKPLGVEMYGIAAKAVTLAYHLYALPSTPHRLRVGLDWALGAVLPRPLVQLGLVREEDASLAVAERTGIYATSFAPLEEERSARGNL